MKSLMYRSPRFYTLTLRVIHGKELERRYGEVLKIAGKRRIFEVGCGPALLGRFVGRERYSGMELNKRFVRYARKRGYNCVMGDIFRDNFPEAEVGVAVDILHHITPREKELIDRMRAHFETVIVVEPVSAFNVRMPGPVRKLWDSLFGDADGINSLENRKRWQFTEKELMEYMKGLGAEKVYVLGKDLISVFRGLKDPDR